MKVNELIWKDVPGFEGYYKIATDGTVKSIPHTVSSGTRFEHISKEHIIKPHLEKDGYLLVKLCKCGIVSTHRVHRLVALAFVPNPNSLPEVNHKDENKVNNHPDNLEWCTKAYNTRYGTRTQRTSKRVYQLSPNGTLLCMYNSVREASRETGIAPCNIRNCASGRLIHSKNGDYITRTAGGFKWEFENN